MLDAKDNSLLCISAFASLLVLSLLRMLSKRLNIKMPHCTIFLLFGALYGLVRKQTGSLVVKFDQGELERLFLSLFDTIYVPIIFFKTAFFIDYHRFDKCIMQIVVIIFLVVPVQLLFLGSVMRIIINQKWTIPQTIFFGSMCMTIYPGNLVKLLESATYTTKHVITLLEGEAILGLSVISVVNSMLLYGMAGVMAHWYQFACSSIRCIISTVIIGSISGYFGTRLMRIFYNDVTSLLFLTISITFISYHLSAVYGGTNFGVIVVGAIMSKEKTYLTHAVNDLLKVLWKYLGFVVNVVMVVSCGAYLTYFASNYISIYDVSLVFLTYIIDITGRTFAFYLFHPLLSRLGYGMTYAHRTICIWGGIKNAFNLAITMQIFSQNKYSAGKIGETFFLHSVMLFFLSSCMHGFSNEWLKVLGVTQPPLTSQINMHHCMKFIIESKKRYLQLTKLNKHTMDCNWVIIDRITELKHPYKKDFDEKEDFEEYIDLRISVCPKCFTRVLSDPTQKEFNEMYRDAKLRVLKAKKAMYRKMFENELISKDALRLLVHNCESAMSTRNALTNTQTFSNVLAKESVIEKFVHKQLQKMDVRMTKKLRPPRTMIRRFCFRVATYQYFETFILVVIIVDSIVLFLFDMNDDESKDFIYFEYPLYVKPITSTVFFLIYAIEMIIKVLAFTKTNIFCDGLITYFNSLWNILDFAILTLALFSLIIEYMYIIISRDVLYELASNLVLVRTARLLKLLRFLNSVVWLTLRRLEWKYDMRAMSAYDTGTVYATVEIEVSRYLRFMTDNERIYNNLYEIMKNESYNMIKMLIIKRKQRPDISMAGRTKQAIITILNHMSTSMYELKSLGLLDQVELDNFMKMMMERYKVILSMKSEKFSVPAPMEIFKEVTWIENDKKITDFLCNNVRVAKFDPGEPIIQIGEMLNGIYIVITGVFGMSYTPDEETIKIMQNFGILPIIDYMSTCGRYTNPHKEHILPGNCIGELATLVGRPYSCTIVSDAYSQVYYFEGETIKQAMELDPDPINGLKCRIWHAVAIRIARNVLYNVPYYSVLRDAKISLALERSFVPDLEGYEMFEYIYEMISDIILIEGTVVDNDTRKILLAPCYVPKSITQLIISNSKYSRVGIDTTTVLLIIPLPEVEKEKIMEMQMKTLF